MNTAFTTPSADPRTGLIVSGDPPIVRGRSRVVVLVPVVLIVECDRRGDDVVGTGIESAAPALNSLPAPLRISGRDQERDLLEYVKDHEAELAENFEADVLRSD